MLCRRIQTYWETVEDVNFNIEEFDELFSKVSIHKKNAIEANEKKQSNRKNKEVKK